MTKEELGNSISPDHDITSQSSVITVDPKLLTVKVPAPQTKVLRNEVSHQTIQVEKPLFPDMASAPSPPPEITYEFDDSELDFNVTTGSGVGKLFGGKGDVGMASYSLSWE
jgi:hypothetical protein